MVDHCALHPRLSSVLSTLLAFRALHAPCPPCSQPSLPSVLPKLLTSVLSANPYSILGLCPPCSPPHTPVATFITILALHPPYSLCSPPSLAPCPTTLHSPCPPCSPPSLPSVLSALIVLRALHPPCPPCSPSQGLPCSPPIPTPSSAFATRSLQPP